MGASNNSLRRQSRIIHYLERMVMYMLRHLIWQSVIYNIQFGEVHIPGQHNVKTDVLSKKNSHWAMSVVRQ